MLIISNFLKLKKKEKKISSVNNPIMAGESTINIPFRPLKVTKNVKKDFKTRKRL